MADPQADRIYVVCQCGRKLSVRAESAGKRAKCPRCGARFVIPAPGKEPPPLPQAEGQEADGLLLEELARYASAAGTPAVTEQRTCPQCHSPMAADAVLCVQCGYHVHSGKSVAGVVTAPSEQEAMSAYGRGTDAGADVGVIGRSFISDVMRAFGLFGKFKNFLIWIVFAVFLKFGLTGAMFLGCLGFPVELGLYGSIFSFCLNTIRNVAGREDDLPDAGDLFDIWEGAFLPLLQFVGSLIVVGLPPGIVAFVMWKLGFPAEQLLAVTVPLSAVCLFLWPVIILAVSLGGLTVVYRPDMLLRAILTAPLQYIFVWVLLVVTVAALVAVKVLALVALVVAPKTLSGLLTGVFLVGFAIQAAELYALIVSMSLIGLYYRHYHRRFPWGMG
jgi:ribosomal protein S27AE